MKLLVDVGNTTINFASLEQNEVKLLTRFYTKELSFDKLNARFASGFKFDEIVISSVVPSTHNMLSKFFESKYGLKPYFIKVGDYPNLEIDIDNPNELGIDLYCDVIGALRYFKEKKEPILVVDLGTASKILLVDGTTKFSSCAILPGINMSKEMLSNSTALLPNAQKEEIKLLTKAKNTIEVINSSVYYGHIEMINGLLKRFEKELNKKCHHVITGGNANSVYSELDEPKTLDLNLLFNGMAEIIKSRGK